MFAFGIIFALQESKTARVKLEKPEIVAFITALVTGISVAIMLWLLLYVLQQSVRPWLVLLMATAIGLVTFLVSLYTNQSYIYSKVKLIFKTIHEIKAGTEQEEDLIARKSNLSQVEKEVAAWTVARKTEIAELEERETFRREFIGNVSHELKTPIFNIQGYVLTLLDGGLEDQNINLKYLTRASKSVDRMINIIQDMDTLNKLESGIMEVKKRSFDIDKRIRDVMDMLEDSAKERNITLYPPSKKKLEIHAVLADPSRIEQVLYNLITNAIKYGRKGSKVEAKLYDLDDRFLIEISDNGLGIPEKDVPRIFERFYRVDKSRTRDAGGSGLGLAIVKHILDTHQETINVRSLEGVGSTFGFTLKKAAP